MSEIILHVCAIFKPLKTDIGKGKPAAPVHYKQREFIIYHKISVCGAIGLRSA